ncbi:uncharacterized protein LOC135834710 isoform X2 [Planococcus citri]|uniref:uncharacterized protein LOC135834710 isoform X2 n=1 Tax=Planococcus citri TaxID=170843 RepID=UPI0031F96592
MLHLPVTLLSLLLIGHGFCVEEDNLRNALNSIANRQRQLAAASNYYVVPNKEADKEVPFEDELMYLDSPPREYDISNREPIGYPYTSRPPSKPHRYYEEDRTPDLDTEEYQKELKERLLERLMLDILETDEDSQPPPPPSSSSSSSRSRPQKKSFFREREFSEIPENLQNLYANGDQEESLFLPPSPFRERAKTKPRSHTRLVKSYEADDSDEAEDYLQAFNSLLEKYRDSTGQDFDPESITNEDVEGFLKFLNDKDPSGYYEYVLPDQEFPIKTISSSRDEPKRSSRGKRYWLGSNTPDRNNERFLIQKRSAVEDKPSPPSSTDKINSTIKPAQVTKSPSSNKTKSSPKKADSGKPDKYRPVKEVLPKGQKELPVDLKSQKPLNIKKKSVDWSNYFGVDKRSQKRSELQKDQRKNDVLLDQYIQNYILQSVRNSAFNNRGSEYRYFPKRNVKHGAGHEQLETDEDLRTAEDLIIDNVLKYTGAHEGITDPREIQRFRENVINELAAAYNLEKLRKELFDDTRRKKFTVDDMAQHHHSNNKRVATKKDSAESSLGLDGQKIKHNATFFNHEHVSKPSTHDYSKRRWFKRRISIL